MSVFHQVDSDFFLQPEMIRRTADNMINKEFLTNKSNFHKVNKIGQDYLDKKEG